MIDDRSRAFIGGILAILVALIVSAHAVAAHKKKCRSLCKSTVSACISAQLDTACAGTSGRAAKKCKRRNTAPTKHACRQTIMSECAADSDPTRCLPPTTSTTTTSTTTSSSEPSFTTTTTPFGSTTTTTPLPCDLTGNWAVNWTNQIFGGGGDGQFAAPLGVAVDGNGSVFVVDSLNNRIQKFTNSGTFLTTWGSGGSGDGQFVGPEGVAVDGSGNVFVVESGGGGIPRIQKFTSAGTFLTTWNGLEFGDLVGVAVDGSGNVYVSDLGNDLIQKFTNTGTLLTTWGSAGSGGGQFLAPVGVAVDGSGNIFVADYVNDNIQKFTNTGTFLTAWGSGGSGNGQFDGPEGVAVDGSGNVFVADYLNNRIQKFTNTGTFLTTWGTLGIGDGQFSRPFGVAVDGSGNVYVADARNNRIQKFTNSGTFLTTWGSGGGAACSSFSIVQTGGNVSATGTCIRSVAPQGTFDCSTGHLMFTSDPNCTSLTFDATVTADGTAFSGTYDCVGVGPGTISATRQ